MERQHIINILDSHFREFNAERPKEITPRMVFYGLTNECKRRFESGSEEMDKLLEAESIIGTWSENESMKQTAGEFASKLMSEVYSSLLQRAQNKEEINNLSEEFEAIVRNIQLI